MHEPVDVYEEVVRKLKIAARTNRTVDAAQVHLINLTEIIQRAGRHWPLVRERIRAGSVEFLKGCLAEEDIIIPCGDGFLIIFGQGERTTLAARCIDIEELLTAFYTGQEGLEALQANVQKRKLEEGALDELMRLQASDAPAPEHRSFGGRQLVFAPVWSARAELIACHFCKPTLCEHGIVRTGYNPDYRAHGRHEGEIYDSLDMEILDEALAAIAHFDETGARGMVGASVHVSTLRHQRSRMTYFARLAGAPHTLTQRLIVQVAEIEVGAPPFTLADWIGMLRGHVRRVALEFHHTERSLDRLGEIGAWAAGFQLPPHRRDVSEGVLKIMRDQLATWGRATQRQQVKLCVENFRSAALLHAARDAGLEMATSDVFWPARASACDVTQAPIPSERVPAAGA